MGRVAVVRAVAVAHVHAVLPVEEAGDRVEELVEPARLEHRLVGQLVMAGAAVVAEEGGVQEQGQHDQRPAPVVEGMQRERRRRRHEAELTEVVHQRAQIAPPVQFGEQALVNRRSVPRNLYGGGLHWSEHHPTATRSLGHPVTGG